MADDQIMGSTPAEPPAVAAAHLVRRALKGALGTLDRQSGHPYSSLVTVAADTDGTPLLLLSRLALHTRNLEADPRASLMIDGTGGDGDPMAGGRVTLVGRAAPTASGTAARRFLARHPAAAMYAGFSDFRFYGLTVERAHYVGGFGRIVDLPPAAFHVPLDGADGLIAAEPDILAAMNEEYVAALAVIARENGADGAARWRMTGIDPAGFDLTAGADTLRIAFDGPVCTLADARAALVYATAAALPHGGRSRVGSSGTPDP